MSIRTSQQSIDACAAHYGDDADAMRAYLYSGEEQALALGNRGPIKFDQNGRLTQQIRDAYSKHGFYIFEGALSAEELEDIKSDLEQMRERFPVGPNAPNDAHGNPALGAGHQAPNLLWSKPLADPLGGTALANGRHQVKLFEPKAAEDAPAYAPFILLGSLQFSEACLRAYGHPDLLRVAADINGEDFAPFHECLFIKDPGLGAAVSWHQDGDTHWESAEFDEGIHGFNFMAQIYGSTAVNGVWVIPGTHRDGRVDIKSLVAEAGSERLPGAVPILCGAGDVVICNRQIVHGSFANTGFERRVTVNFGFHRRKSVLNVQGAGIHSAAVVYDEELIGKRAEVLGLAIQARSERYPAETPFRYAPQQGQTFRWTPQTKAELRDYNLRDLSI